MEANLTFPGDQGSSIYTVNVDTGSDTDSVEYTTQEISAQMGFYYDYQ